MNKTVETIRDTLYYIDIVLNDPNKSELHEEAEKSKKLLNEILEYEEHGIIPERFREK